MKHPFQNGAAQLLRKHFNFQFELLEPAVCDKTGLIIQILQQLIKWERDAESLPQIWHTSAGLMEGVRPLHFTCITRSKEGPTAGWVSDTSLAPSVTEQCARHTHTHTHTDHLIASYTPSYTHCMRIISRLISVWRTSDLYWSATGTDWLRIGLGECRCWIVRLFLAGGHVYQPDQYG